MSSKPIRFAIVCPVWNSEAWVRRCLQSIRSQTHRNFRCVLIDDVSDDRTYERAQQAATGDDRFQVLRNETRSFPLANIVRATALAAHDPDDVIVIVDGDDWLKHDRVLELLARVYADPEVWLTYGSHELYRKPLRDRLLRRVVRGKTARQYPDVVLQSGLYRYCPFFANHLRSYRKFLFDAIGNEDLRDEHGKYWWAAGDLATMIPMLEMATAQHIRYLPDILYVYNNNHPWSEMRTETRYPKLLVKLQIQARTRYQPLERL